jgi:plastocyanin
MREYYWGKRMEKTKVLKLSGIHAGLLLLLVLLLPGQVLGQTAGPTTHTIFMTAVEVKGGTTADKLAPPPVNPKDLSKGYEFKPPGEADKSNPQRWEVSSYRFDPGFVAVRQGDTLKLTAFVVNGDEHHVRVNDPDGREVIAETKWNRGREYQLSFVAKKLGTYYLTCSDHAPTMAATILVLPRK